MACDNFILPSKIHESLFVGYLWSNPRLYKKYKDYNISQFKDGEGTMTEDIWYFYFSLGKAMSENGVQNFSDTTVYSFISSQPDIGGSSWIRDYNKYGGFPIIYQVMQECKKDDGNESYHFSEIQKYELLRFYEQNGLLNPEFEVVKKNRKIKMKDLLPQLTLEKVKSYFQYYVKKGGQSVGNTNIKTSNFLDGITESVAELDKGERMGVSLFDSPRLNSIIKGWQKGNFIFLVLASGVGKSTFSMNKFLLGILNSNEKCMMFVNEENKKRAHHTMLSTVSGSITDIDNPITRERLSMGKFTSVEWEKINKAKAWLESKPSNQIKFGEIEKFLLTDVTENLELNKSLGYNYGILDTMKPDSSKVELARWEKFGQHAQDIFDCIKPTANNIGMLATLQLKIGMEQRYLDLECIGKAREPVEVADIVLMGRLLFEDEYDDTKMCVYDNEYSEELGTYIRKEIKLDRTKEYMILFIPKNRNGSKSQQIIYEVDYDTNKWTEIGFASLKKSAK